MVRLVNRKQTTADNGLLDKRMLQFREYAIAITTLLTSLIFSDTPGDPEGYVRDATVRKFSELILYYNQRYFRSKRNFLEFNLF
jgi:hypothetical protein